MTHDDYHPLFEISFGDISIETIRGVAERCNLTEERVRAYLSSDEQNDELLRAFLFYGITPIRKTFQAHQPLPVTDPVITMGCTVPYKR